MRFMNNIDGWRSQTAFVRETKQFATMKIAPVRLLYRRIRDKKKTRRKQSEVYDCLCLIFENKTRIDAARKMFFLLSPKVLPDSDDHNFVR
jgi:hypothetical protein